MYSERVNTGSRVAFRIADARCPAFEQIIAQIGPDLTVSGEVVLLSDSGSDKDHFVIVNVDGINAPLIVPVKKLHAGLRAGDDDVQRRAWTRESAGQ